MARSVLRKSPDGNGYELVCAPENEAAIYAAGADARSLAEGVRVRRAGQAHRLRSQLQRRARDRPGQPGARHRRRLRLQLRRGTGHLLQIEKPEECIRLTLEFLGKHGLA